MVKTKITPRKAPAKKPQETEKPFSCGTCGTRFMKRAYMNVHIKKFHTGSSDSKIVSPSTSSKSVVSPSTSLKSVVSPSFSSPKELDYEDLSDPEIELLDAKSDESAKSSPEVVKADLNEGNGKEALVQEESIEMQIEEKVPDENNNTSDMMKGTDSRKVEAIYLGRTYSKPTHPMRPYAPKRKASESGPSGEEVVKQKKASDSDSEDIDEIQINMKDNMKKRLVLKFPGGKKLEMNLKFK